MIGIFIIVESWLNDRANNKTQRKSLITLYVNYLRWYGFRKFSVKC